jgi:two-component system response regulator HupR/HoxA
LQGESGTGKELLARAVHYASGRADKAFVVENCGALPDTLLESELFGHKRGAFTGAYEERIGLFQQADGGSLFLDEIGETSPAFQVKLLRVLQEGEFRPLGSSRPQRVDLRERPMDIPLLAASILAQASAGLGRPATGLGPDVLAHMAAYAWPGNVRELMNEIQRMLVLSDGATLGMEQLAPAIRRAGPAAAAAADETTGLRGQVDALESRLLQDTLARHRGNISRAAQELGLSRLGLRSKMQRLGVERPARADKAEEHD